MSASNATAWLYHCTTTTIIITIITANISISVLKQKESTDYMLQLARLLPIWSLKYLRIAQISEEKSDLYP